MCVWGGGGGGEGGVLVLPQVDMLVPELEPDKYTGIFYNSTFSVYTYSNFIQVVEHFKQSVF